MLSLTCEYAIRALTYLATQKQEETTLSSQISEKAHIPTAYLSKILLNLKDFGILNSLKGPGGGFFFVKDPAEIQLKEVVSIFDPNITSENNCVMGLAECGGDCPCPIHDIWAPFRERLFEILEKTSIASMANEVTEKRAFLVDEIQEKFHLRRSF